MILLARFAPFLIAIAFFGSVMVVLGDANAIRWMPAVFLVLLLALGQVSAREDMRSRSFWLLMLAPVLLTVTAFGFESILVHPLWRWIVVGAVTVLLLWFFQNVYQFRYDHERYQLHAIENISTYMNLVAVFFMATTLSSLLLYFHISHYLLLLLGLALFLLLVLQILWMHEVKIRKQYAYIIVLPLALTQVLWAALWLPTNFFVVGTLVTLCYYALTSLARQHILERLDATVLRRYAMIALLGILITLSTAQWT